MYISKSIHKTRNVHRNKKRKRKEKENLIRKEKIGPKVKLIIFFLLIQMKMKAIKSKLIYTNNVSSHGIMYIDNGWLGPKFKLKFN